MKSRRSTEGATMSACCQALSQPNRFGGIGGGIFGIYHRNTLIHKAAWLPPPPPRNETGANGPCFIFSWMCRDERTRSGFTSIANSDAQDARSAVPAIGRDFDSRRQRESKPFPPRPQAVSYQSSQPVTGPTWDENPRSGFTSIATAMRRTRKARSRRNAGIFHSRRQRE